jgi:tetratricopeptide (TPR) repeat protein
MEQGLNLLRSADPPDPEKTAFALAWFAFMMVMRGEYGAATKYAQESLNLFPQTGDLWTQAGSLRLLGASALYQGQLTLAQDYLNKCVSVCKSIGELRIRTYATSNLGVIHLWYGQYEQARQYFEESLRVSLSCNDRLSRADALCERGRLFLATGEYDRAIETASTSMSLYQDLGRTQMSMANIIRGKALRLKGAAGAEEALNEGLSAARSMNHKPDIASALEGLGALAVQNKDYEQAESYFRKALAIWTELGHEPEIATLSCRIGFCILASGSLDSQRIREYLIHAMQLGAKHQAGSIVITAMVGLAALHLQEGGGDLDRLASLLLYAQRSPVTPFEVRTWLEQQINNLPVDQSASTSAELETITWQEMAESWEHEKLF